MKHILYCTALLLVLPWYAMAAEHQGADYIEEGELQWGPAESMGEGAEVVVLEGDPSQPDPFTMRLRLEDGYQLLPHTHPEHERVTVLSGTLHFGHGENMASEDTRALEPGDMVIMPPGEPMFGEAEGETVVQLHGSGPWGIEYVDPEDDPRSE